MLKRVKLLLITTDDLGFCSSTDQHILKHIVDKTSGWKEVTPEEYNTLTQAAQYHNTKRGYGSTEPFALVVLEPSEAEVEDLVSHFIEQNKIRMEEDKKRREMAAEKRKAAAEKRTNQLKKKEEQQEEALLRELIAKRGIPKDLLQ